MILKNQFKSLHCIRNYFSNKANGLKVNMVILFFFLFYITFFPINAFQENAYNNNGPGDWCDASFDNTAPTYVNPLQLFIPAKVASNKKECTYYCPDVIYRTHLNNDQKWEPSVYARDYDGFTHKCQLPDDYNKIIWQESLRYVIVRMIKESICKETNFKIEQNKEDKNLFTYSMPNRDEIIIRKNDLGEKEFYYPKYTGSKIVPYSNKLYEILLKKIVVEIARDIQVKNIPTIYKMEEHRYLYVLNSGAIINITDGDEFCCHYNSPLFPDPLPESCGLHDLFRRQYKKNS